MSDLENLLERFRRTPEVLAVILTGVFGEEVDFVPAAGKWSIRQLARHVTDAEMVASHRFRSVVAEENPTLIGFDQEAWTARLDYGTRKPANSLEYFRRIRADNYELLRNLPAETFGRKGRHLKRGELTLAGLVEMHAAHAEEHAKQMQSVREAYKQAKGKK